MVRRRRGPCAPLFETRPIVPAIDLISRLAARIHCFVRPGCRPNGSSLFMTEPRCPRALAMFADVACVCAFDASLGSVGVGGSADIEPSSVLSPAVGCSEGSRLELAASSAWEARGAWRRLAF